MCLCRRKYLCRRKHLRGRRCLLGVVLIPLSASVTAGYLLPAVFAVATAIPVLAVAWILAFSVQQMGSFYGKMQKVQKWMNLLVGVVFILIGIYYCWIMYV
mgnify:FL=1